MFRTGSIDMEPVVDASLVVDTETWQTGDCITLIHVVQADHTFSFLLQKDILIITNSRLCQTHDQMALDIVIWDGLRADGALNS